MVSMSATSECLEESPGPMRIREGSLEVLLAENAEAIRGVQKLRYKIFYEEEGATPPSAEIQERGYDFDSLDDFCDHLIVREWETEKIVGTYRLIHRQAARCHGRFYSASEYDISMLENYPGEILELGRACVMKEYRTRGALQLLWKGLERYMNLFSVKLMFGCANFSGTDPEKHKHALSYLHHFHLAPENLRPVARDPFVEMNRLPVDQIDRTKVHEQLPSMIKGYVHLGCRVGHGAFVDKAFGSLDVCIVFETKQLARKYLGRVFSSV